MTSRPDGTGNDSHSLEARDDSDVRQLRPQPDSPGGAGWLGGKNQGGRLALVGFAALLTAGLTLHVRWLLSEQKLSDAVATAGSWLKMFSSDNLAAILLVFGPFAALLLGVAVLLIHFGMPQVWQSARRSLQVGALLGACLAAAWLVGTTRLAGLKTIDWLFFVPAIPPALLAFQALLTWRQRPRSVGDFRLGVSAPLYAALEQSGDKKRFDEVHTQLVNVFGGIASTAGKGQLSGPRSGTPRDAPRRGSYTPASFATQFAVPGLLLLLVGFGALALAVNDPSPDKAVRTFSEPVLRGLRWGVAGAYTYVLFTFGSRAFRNDLTVGAATWAIITLITGPTLAVILALVWNMKATDGNAWQTATVLFFAGLAPRRVMSIVEGVALQFLKSPNETTSKLIPLTTLRGISPELALRLREENIEDVVGLAYADPIRLVQSVPYDLRQVIEWIDGAQLAVALPEHYLLLNQRGVTGAIDLGWRWLQACEAPPGSEKIAIVHAKGVPDSFKSLVREADREAAFVYETARQMFYEEQVRLLWVMYNCFSTTAGDQDLIQEASTAEEDGAPGPGVVNPGNSKAGGKAAAQRSADDQRATGS